MPNEAFVPLTTVPASASAARDFRVLVAEHPERAQAFRPQSATVSGNSSGTIPAHPAGEPRVTLERDGDRVTAIRIQCACGQVIDLACAY